MDIFEAARSGNIKALARMIKGGAKVINQEDKHGVTALMHASFSSRPDAVRLLIKASGCNVEFKNYKDIDAIGLALENNRKTVLTVFEELLPEYYAAKLMAWQQAKLTSVSMAAPGSG